MNGKIEGSGGLGVNRTKALADDFEIGPKQSFRSGVHPQYLSIAIEQDHCSSTLLICTNGARRASVHSAELIHHADGLFPNVP